MNVRCFTVLRQSRNVKERRDVYAASAIVPKVTNEPLSNWKNSSCECICTGGGGGHILNRKRLREKKNHYKHSISREKKYL